MERKKLKNKNEYKYIKFRKKKNIKKYRIKKSHLIKFFLLIIFLVLYSQKKHLPNNNEMQINNIPLNIDPSTLPQNEHYKLLFPRKKYHNYKNNSNEGEINLFKLEDSVDYQKMKEKGNNTYIYHSCLLTKVKNENLYIREFVEYYLNLGVDKFYFGDDNSDDLENLSDILADYIKKGIVDVEYIYFRNMMHHDFCEYGFKTLKFRCKWILIFSIDEFLEFKDKNMNLKTYLDMPIFDKCNAIRIHWLIYDDNNLLYYDNRTLRERFTHPLPNHKLNMFHKPIVRGKDFGVNMFSEQKTAHQPSKLVKNQCDAEGNIEIAGNGVLTQPKFKYCFIRHHVYKSAEEFAMKMLRGSNPNHPYNVEKGLMLFSEVNELTEEKLKIIENIVNRTFPKFHKKRNNDGLN